MDHIKRCTRRLVKKYNTRDPFLLAHALGFIIIYKELPKNLLGMYLDCSCRKVIALNSWHDENTHRLTIAHEIGHQQLHKGYNRRFLIAHTLYNKGRYEKEADQFSAELLIPDDYFQKSESNLITIEQIAVSECVPIYLAELKCNEIKL